ncbi:hypothetical protein AYL99_11178 [Fonsecaea erecta]|uniref:Uncharacterized protein n=1 Tax=Fonsecaea erecta TaxID=1367422 RepID=A0A178Z4P4_9EURO|nr:hypothetical protein AYL99_11178 [Fonsecaea erecta]OAP54730.1 hypothetical protein AYL99_11178 [Fonsecaea erecta]
MVECLFILPRENLKQATVTTGIGIRPCPKAPQATTALWGDSSRAVRSLPSFDSLTAHLAQISIKAVKKIICSNHTGLPDTGS